MADIESNVKVNIDTSDALAQLKLLQQQISAFQQAMRKAGADNALAARQMQQNLVNSINATGKFQANIQTIQTSAERFTSALEKNKLSMGEYFRYAGGASKTFGKLFKAEFETINQVARERVKELQTQYIKLGRDANGAMKAIAVKPLALDMDNLGTKTQMAAQRQQLFNQLMKQGSTNLLNFGKNTQWAGRQLMVGFTVPLTLMGSAAAKAYMEIEKASISFKRVYGDINTTADETEKMARSVRALADEFTKYGAAVSDTMDMAAKAAAMGKTGSDLLAQISQAAKLAVLGQVDQNQALETTISLTNAFGTSAEDLSKKIDFLNAVENQTVTSIEDLTIAIPKAAPVVEQLGGNVEDLAFFLTAMKEGGINASEGANALKSGLASMINPSKKASDFLAGFNINVKGIVEANKGDVKGTVIGMAKAFDTLDPLNRARAIEQLFGKFQFSRISTLFQNVIKEGSQANTVAGLAKQTAEELAVLSEREMKKISDSPMYKFQKTLQDIQAKLAPVGEAFLKAVTPIIEFVSKILDGFNNLGEGSKQFITILVTAVAGIGPLLLMTFGLVANGIANIMKLFTNIKSFMNKTTKPSDILGEQTAYMNTEQLRAAAIAGSLDQAHAKLRQTFTSETQAVEQLTAAYRNAVQAQQAFAGVPGVPVGNPKATPKKYANGVSMVPGPAGAGDIVPALLSPGEAVIPARHAKKYAPVIAGMVAGNLPGFENGTTGAGMRQSVYGPLTQKQTDGLARTGAQLKDISDEVKSGPYGNVPPTDFGTQISPTTGHSFPAFSVGGIYEKPDGTRVFVKPQMDLTSALAEVRGTTIARDAHGLVAPKQEIRVMMDPTDPEGQRKFIVLESALDSRIADIPNSFNQDQYFTQLVASLLRGDKDLGVGNLGGNVLADVGTAGVFGRASGKRALGSAINSMEEQAIINLLGVKGGAKRFFAEATSEMVSKMTPAEYDAAMKAEIQKVMPKLDATIAGFGPMSPEETVAYQAMQQRLRGGLGVDWGKYQSMHSAVPPKKYEDGTEEVPAYDYEALARLSPKEREKLLSIQDTHSAGPLSLSDKNVQGQVSKVYKKWSGNPEEFKDFEILSNLTMMLPGRLNQAIKETTKTGMPGVDFANAYDALFGKLSKTAKMAGVKDLSQSQQLENLIGKRLRSEPFIKDKNFARIVEEVINDATVQNSPIAGAANLIWERSKQAGTARSKFQDIGDMSAHQIVHGMLQRGEVGFWNVPSSLDTPFGARMGRWGMNNVFGDSKTTKGKIIRARATQIYKEWVAKNAPLWKAPLPQAPRDLVADKDGNYSAKSQGSAFQEIKFRSSSEQGGQFSTDEFPAYDDTSVKYTVSPDEFGVNPGGWQALAQNQALNKNEAKRLGIPGYEKGIASVGATGKPKASVFDIDDTLLDLSSFMVKHKEENDKLPEGEKKKWYKEAAKDPKGIPAGLAALKAAQARGNKILLMTARPDFYEPYTIETLQKLGIDMNGIKVIARKDKDYRKPYQMKYDKTSAYMKYYDIEEFYDDMAETRGAISLLGIPTYNPLKLAKGGIIPGYANGVFSVPGPKGAGDVVPAMLSPGEAVIPARQAGKHRGLISQMISGNLPGYAMGGMIPGYVDGIENVPGGRPVPVILVEDRTQTDSGARMEEVLTMQEEVAVGELGAQEEKKKTDKEIRKDIKEQQAKAKERAEEEKRFRDNEKRVNANYDQMSKAEKQKFDKKLSGGGVSGFIGKATTPNKFSGKMAGAGYIASGVAAAASALPTDGPLGGVAQAAQAALPAIGAMTGAMSMIPGPAGVAVGAIMAIGTIIGQVNAALTKMREESYALASAMGSGNAAIQKFADFAKTVSGTEAMNKKREASAGQFFNVVEGKTTFGESYMKSDSGKQLVKDVGESIKAGGFTQAKTMITQQLSTAIAAGVMTTAQARSIAANLGKQLKSTDFALSVSAKLTDTFGPNGENLKENPLQVRMGIAKESTQLFKKFTKDAVEAGSSAFGSDEKLGGALAANLQSTLDVQQQMVDSLQIDYEKRIAIARAAGDTTEATRLQTQYLSEQKTLLEANAAAGKEIFKQLEGLDSGVLGQVKTAAIASIETAYKGTGQEAFATIAKDRVENKFSGSTDEQKAQLASMVASKQIGFQQLELAQKMYGGDSNGSEELSKMLSEKGGVETNRALGLASSMKGETQKKFLIDFGLADPAKAKEMNDAMELAQKTIGPFADDAVTKKAMIEFNVLNTKEVIDAKKNIDALQGLSGEKITIAVTTGSLFDANTKAAIKRDIKRFNKYNDANKIVYTTELQQIMKMEGNAAMMAAYEVWKSESGNKTKTFADYASYQADRTVRTQGTDNTTGPGSQKEQKEIKAPEPSILDPYVKMLREANNWQQKLTTGWNDSFKAIMKYTSASIKKMGGFAVLMQEQGAAAEEIQAFMNGTEKEQNMIIDRKTGQLKKNAGELLKKLKQIREASEIGLKYVLMSPAEKLAKDNELYQAGLDVIGTKEKGINEKYDKRIKALDEIGRLQSINNQKESDSLDLADALSKGDIAAAARAAQKARQNNQKNALEDAKTSIENARKSELEDIEVSINGVLMRRTDIDKILTDNASKIAGYKLKEAQHTADIEQNALKSAKHMANLLRDGKAISLLKPYNPGTLGSVNSNVGNDKDNDKDKGKDKKDVGPAGSKKSIAAGTAAKGKVASVIAAATSGATTRDAAAAQAKTYFATNKDLKNFKVTEGKMKGKVLDMTKTSNRKFATGAADIAALEALDTKLSGATSELKDRGITATGTGTLTANGKTFINANDIQFMSNTAAAALNTKADIEAAYAQLPQEAQILKNLIFGSDDVTTLSHDWNQEYTSSKNGYGGPANRLKGAFGRSKDFKVTDDLSSIIANPTSLASIKGDYKAKWGGTREFDRDIQVVKTINDKWVQAQQMRKALEDMGYKSKELEGFLGPDALKTPKTISLINGGKGYSTSVVDKIVGAGHYAMGGLVAPKGYADGGAIYGTDTIPAMLTPGEFVIKKSAVDSIGVGSLNAMNNGTSVGESVYNYSITVNATGNMDANDLARKVMEQIKQVDSQRMRSNNY